jgi:hypothetical protein
MIKSEGLFGDRALQRRAVNEKRSRRNELWVTPKKTLSS